MSMACRSVGGELSIPTDLAVLFMRLPPPGGLKEQSEQSPGGEELHFHNLSKPLLFSLVGSVISMACQSVGGEVSIPMELAVLFKRLLPPGGLKVALIAEWGEYLLFMFRWNTSAFFTFDGKVNTQGGGVFLSFSTLSDTYMMRIYSHHLLSLNIFQHLICCPLEASSSVFQLSLEITTNWTEDWHWLLSRFIPHTKLILLYLSKIKFYQAKYISTWNE